MLKLYFFLPSAITSQNEVLIMTETSSNELFIERPSQASKQICEKIKKSSGLFSPTHIGFLMVQAYSTDYMDNMK